MQEAIWSVQEGRTGSLLRIAMTFILAAASLGLFAWFRFTGLSDPVAMEQCSLARNLADGKGYVATCIRPADSALLHDSGHTADLTRFPELRQEPAYPVALSCLMRLFPIRYESSTQSGVFKPETKLVIPFGILCTLATAGILFLLTRALFPPEAAAVAAVAFLLWDPVLSHSISGNSHPFVMFTTTLSLWLATIAARACDQERAPRFWLPLAAAAGIAAGITFLGAYALWPAIPGTAILAACLSERRRGTLFLVLTAAAILTITPWLIRNMTLSGNPFGTAPWTLLDGTSLFPSGSWDASSATLPTRAAVISAIKAKFLANLPGRLESVFQLLGGTVLAALFIVSFFIRFESEAANRARWPILGIALAILIAGSLGDNRSASHLQALLPLVAAFGTAAVLVLAEHRDYVLPETRALIAWSMVGLNALPCLLRIWGTAPEHPYPPYFPPLNAYAAQQIPETKILCSDIPWATAWYGARTSILTPATPSDFERLQAAYPSISAIYLAAPRNRPVSGVTTNNWMTIESGWIPAGFALTNGIFLPPGTKDQLLLLGKTPGTADAP
jgi:hypothetical protein